MTPEEVAEVMDTYQMTEYKDEAGDQGEGGSNT
jgi:hypothetical protein